ncbi:glycosyltransferase family 2 protein [Lusitaniella coriacea]|uniref:glycosyltransferase family 2 protein n=1 Tax=Lusitaniella coriacea TaxID=1983105 RepID=UPI003CF73819
MKFSIIITTHNRLPLLQRSIRTALEQTVPSEVIVVDDCSSDGTQDYVRSLCAQLQEKGDNRLIYHRNLENQGHSKSVNIGVDRATGDWVKLVDDDDYIAANCIGEMTHAIALRPQAAICSCQAVKVDEHEKELGRTKKVGPGKAFYIPQEDIHHGMLLEQVPFGTPVQVAFRRDAFLKSGGWDSSLDTNFDDIDSWIRIAQFGDAIFINQCLAYRTFWTGALNQRFSLEERLNTHIEMKQKIYQYVNEKYKAEIPHVDTIENYLKLHWALIALKDVKLYSAMKIAYPAICAPKAWHLLLKRFIQISQEQEQKKVSFEQEINSFSPIRKLVLIES